jgi:hypothetical protein
MLGFPLKITIFLSLLVYNSVFAFSSVAQKHRELHIDVGARISAERDYGYSPLLYSGVEGAVALSYLAKTPKTTNQFTFDFSTGKLNNEFGTDMQVYSAGIKTYTFYHANKPANKGLHWGWSNYNMFGLRDNEAITNFNARNDYYTSFGPALNYQLPFELFKRHFSLQTCANIQLIGFTMLSSYVSSSPRGYVGSNSTGLMKFWESIGLFYPGNALNGGINSSLMYQFKSLNSISIKYQYDYLRLKGSHIVEKSKGNWMIGLIVML